MLKEVSARAQFLDPIQHNEKLKHFTGVSTDWSIEAIVFNIDACKYDVGDDGAFTMHNVEFSDGSLCYFEVLSNGTLSNFMASAYVELRNGLLVVSPRSVFEDRRKKNDKEKEVGLAKKVRKKQKTRSSGPQ